MNAEGYLEYRILVQLPVNTMYIALAIRRVHMHDVKIMDAGETWQLNFYSCQTQKSLASPEGVNACMHDNKIAVMCGVNTKEAVWRLVANVIRAVHTLKNNLCYSIMYNGNLLILILIFFDI